MNKITAKNYSAEIHYKYAAPTLTVSDGSVRVAFQRDKARLLAHYAADIQAFVWGEALSDSGAYITNLKGNDVLCLPNPWRSVKFDLALGLRKMEVINATMEQIVAFAEEGDLIDAFEKADAELNIQDVIEEAAPFLRDARMKKGKFTKRDYARFVKEADAAAEKAARAHVAVPMVVQQHESVLDDSSPVEQQWVVEGGVCGMAWVEIAPATQSFARYLLSTKRASKGHRGGANVWMSVLKDSPLTQSLEKNQAAASAWLAVVRSHIPNLKARTNSRID